MEGNVKKQLTKPSVYFRRADGLGIPQVFHRLFDGKGGFCASGLLRILFKDEGAYTVTITTLGESLMLLNDRDKWTWKRFAEELEKKGQ